MQSKGLLEWLNKLFSREVSLILLYITERKLFAPLNVKIGNRVFVMCSLAFRSLLDD